MTQRPRDTVTIESVLEPGFGIVVDRATQYEIGVSLLEPSIARFELGDESTWAPAREAFAIGGRFSVSINDQPRVTGRLLTRGLGATPESGATVQVTIRTPLADAAFTAVDPQIRTKGATLKQVLLDAFRSLGFTEADFIFKADLARDLITGKSSARRTQGAEEPLEVKVEEAAPQPPESVYAFVDRHLSRFRMMMWDGPDGRIVVGQPDDEQEPLYIMTMRRGAAARANNLLSVTRIEDYEQVPASLAIYGVGGGRDQAAAKIQFFELESVLSAVEPPLDRHVAVIDESLKTLAQAEGRARREMLARSLQKDSWTLLTDGLSYWTGKRSVQYGVDTVADVQADLGGLDEGAHLVHGVRWTGNASEGHTTELQAVARGIFKL